MNQQPDNKAEIPLLTQHFEISAVVRPALIDDERPFYGLAGRGALQLLRVIAEAVAQIGFKAAAARMVLCVVPGPFPYRDTSRRTFVAFVILDRIHSVRKADRQKRKGYDHGERKREV